MPSMPLSSPRSLLVSSMLPQRGEGFIWDPVFIVDDRAVTWIFVPDSKKIFYVSISTKDVKKDNLHPTEWIKWNGVGQRDASKPIPLIESSLNRAIRPVNRSIRPEYVNQTTFESIILFPTRTDLIEFVGKDNAWSPLVGIVRCERGTEVTRGEYCRAYIVRDYDKTGSAFMVNVDTIKFLEGFKSKEDQTIFEGLDREIELAAEEDSIMTSKGRSSKADVQVVPAQMRPQNGDLRGFDRPAEKMNMTRSMDGNRPRWPKKNPKIDAAEVEAKNEFVKAKRYHPIIVYKQKGDRGFVGWTPLIGSIPVYAQYTQYDDQRVEIGHTVQARVECNKRRNELAVESIMNIETVPMIDFEIRKGEKGVHLLVKCLCLDLNEFKRSDKMWNRKRVGVIEHPTLQKVLAYEEDVMKAEWKGKKVRATLQHYEGIENCNPERIRLVLETIDGLVDDDSVRVPSPIVFPVSRPDMVNSDSNGDEEEGYNAYSDDGSEMDMKRTKGKEPSTNFVQVDDQYSDRGFYSQSSFNRRGNGGDERREDGHSRSERGGNGRGARGGNRGWNNQRMAPNRNSSERWSEEDNGFGTVLEQKKTPEWDCGILVCYSRRSSIFYTKSHKIIEYNGDTGFHHVRLGDCASFEFEPSNSSLIPFRVIPGSLEKISDKFFDLTRDEYRGELYIRVRARLTPHGDVFECTEVSDVSLGPSQSSLKLYNHEFVEKSRIKIGHCYDIYVKFCSEELKWTFVCIDQRSDSFEVEEEDEIEAIKRRNESNQSRNSSNRSEDDEWECADRSEHPSRRNDSTHGPRSTRGSDHSNESGTRDPKFALPSLQPSTAPSIASCSTQMTSTTITNGKEMRNLRKENEDLRRMLKNVWNFESVQTSVKIGNYFLYETVDGWLRNHAEEESESVQ